ncbi:MAG: family 78 glycoside hydrolase catalytic domain [Gemmiger sp.]|nr:family 78 glycoside hydrolase catalytic domain [Gemmiger sp.]
MKIVRMQTENRTTPLGIDNTKPVFSWNVETDCPNWKQQTYRIVVQNGGAVVWDSGVAASDAMVQVPYAGHPLCAATRYTWTVEVGDGKGTAKQSSWFETGLLDAAAWQGCFIGETEENTFHLYRKEFEVPGPVKQARLYVCGLGQYVGSLNGQPLADTVLDPPWSDYRKTCFYQTYDVTAQLRAGTNAMGFKLGNGMFNLPGGRYVYFERSYGKMKLLVQLNILYTDGSTASVVTDESWQQGRSPIQFCCMYGGEDYDGRLEQPGYTLPGASTAGWEAAHQVKPPQGTLAASPLQPLRIMQRYTPVAVTQKPEGWLYDFGTNFSGWARITLARNGAPEGTAVTMVPGELLGANGLPDQRVTGQGYHWQYLLNGQAQQTFAPDFTYTGFRYLLVSGAAPLGSAGAGQPILQALTGEFIYPDIETEGSFRCSEPLFEKIHQIVCQAILSNTKSYLTDCPHRERLAWMEQTHLIAPGIMYNYGVQSLYEKMEGDILDAQHADGLIPCICPEYVAFGYHRGFVDTPEWGSAGIINPWYAYQRWGNVALLKKSYEGMKKYAAYLAGKTHHGVLHHGLGDWLDIGPNRPWAQNTPVPVTATAIYYYDLCILQKAAAILGKPEEAAAFAAQAAQVYEEFNAQFFDDQTDRYATGSQAAQAISLVTGLVPPAHHAGVVKKLRQDITNRGYAVTAGDVGHPFLITAAIQEGLSDLIYQMTLKTDVPGYGYQVANGATTLTEEWDGPDPKQPHGSQNHLMLGGIEEWFYGGLGGIRLLHSAQPFGTVEIAPFVPADMAHCAAALRHPYGMVRTAWQQEDGMVHYTIEIPPNLTAVLRLEGQPSCRVGSGVWQYTLPRRKEVEDGTVE